MVTFWLLNTSDRLFQDCFPQQSSLFLFLNFLSILELSIGSVTLALLLGEWLRKKLSASLKVYLFHFFLSYIRLLILPQLFVSIASVLFGAFRFCVQSYWCFQQPFSSRGTEAPKAIKGLQCPQLSFGENWDQMQSILSHHAFLLVSYLPPSELFGCQEMVL